MCLLLVRRVSSLGLNPRVDSLKYRLLSSIVACVNRKGDDASFFASYLIQNFGFTKNYALRNAGESTIKSLENPNAVVALFKDYGFSDRQLSYLIRLRPRLLHASPKLLKSKIDFLNSKFEESAEVARVVSSYPMIMILSLEKRLVPSFNFLSTIFGSERGAACALGRVGHELLVDPDSHAACNLKILLEWGIPLSKLAILFRQSGQTLYRNSMEFEEAMEAISGMGFNPKSSMFAIALKVFLSKGKQSLEAKKDIYKKCGWSEEEFMSAFRSDPYVGAHSGEKIKSVFMFLREKMGVEASAVAKSPRVLGLSLDKRIIPRGCVINTLLTKGLRDKVGRLSSVFCISEDAFLDYNVLPYEESHGLAKFYNNLKRSVASRIEDDPHFSAV